MAVAASRHDDISRCYVPYSDHRPSNGAGPGGAPLTIDLDFTICETSPLTGPS